MKENNKWPVQNCEWTNKEAEQNFNRCVEELTENDNDKRVG